jgi:hypothetical protein
VGGRLLSLSEGSFPRLDSGIFPGLEQLTFLFIDSSRVNSP